MDFFASTDTDTLHPFPEQPDVWITVKRELTAGEDRQLAYSALVRTTRPIEADGTMANALGFSMDVDKAAFVKVSLYLVDWNLPGADGKTVEILSSSAAKVTALRNLKPAIFRAIEVAIDAYVTARLAQKKTAGSPLSGSAS